MEWKTIESAPDLERIWVAGWQPRNRTTEGYWWWAEDMVVNGKPCDAPDATHWCEIVLPPFPPPPSQEPSHD